MVDGPSMKASNGILVLSAVLLAVAGCDKESKKTDGDAPKAEAAPADGKEAAADGKEAEKDDEPAPGEVVLEEAEAGPLGTILLPKGYETAREGEAGGGFRFKLSKDGFERLNIDWESTEGAGVASLAEAKKLAPIVLGNGAELQEEVDLEDGRFKLVAERESDSLIWVVVFNANAYLKCWGPKDNLEHCQKIAESLEPAS
jgi:hypothetical protein